jgi:dethiobiotin synthase
MPKRFFITGTDTNVGKTVVSAMLCDAFNAIYWKPIQTGTRDGSDRATVMRLAGLAPDRTIPEAYRFAPPVSPHLAALQAGTRIDLRKIALPKDLREENLIVEGAGGVLVPINDRELMPQLMARLKLPILLVARTALGTINHTLLSIAALRDARLDLRGVIMVGKPNADNKNAIEYYGSVPVLGILPPLRTLGRATLMKAFRSHFDRSRFK